MKKITKEIYLQEIEQLQNQSNEIIGKIRAIHKEHGYLELEEPYQTRYDELKKEQSQIDEVIKGLKVFMEHLSEIKLHRLSNMV